MFQDEPHLHERLWANTKRFKAELARLGFDTGVSETPITPVIVGESGAAIEFSNRLFDAGVFATSVVFPTVALDRARLRTIVTAAHTDEHLDRALRHSHASDASWGSSRGDRRVDERGVDDRPNGEHPARRVGPGPAGGGRDARRRRRSGASGLGRP